jgi:hypothetical protein
MSGSAGAAAVGRRTAAQLAAAERRRNLALEAQARNRAEEWALESRLEETERLARGRGEALERPPRQHGEGRKPMRRMTGLHWLLAKGRITPLQAQAGQRYGALWDRAIRGDLGSSLRERIGGPAPDHPGEAKMAALQAKEAADWAIRRGLPEEPGRQLVWLCGRVCGETATVREAAAGDRAAAERMEVQLGICLNILAVHFGLAPPARR